MADTTPRAIRDCFEGREDGNFNDVVANIANAVESLSASITPTIALGNTDAGGGYVSSLTEAVMGTTAGLFAIANAIGDLAEAVRERKE